MNNEKGRATYPLFLFVQNAQKILSRSLSPAASGILYFYTLFKIFCINIHFYPFCAKCLKTDRKTANILCNIYLTNIKKTIDKPLVMCYTNYAEGHGKYPNKLNKKAQSRKRENVMEFKSIRLANYTARMTIEKGIVYFTDKSTGKIKHHININEGAIYSYARKVPTPMASGVYFNFLEYNEQNPLESFIANFLKVTYCSGNQYNNLFNNFAFCESVLKIYGYRISAYLINELKRYHVNFPAETKELILKDKTYVEWCFNNSWNPFCNYDRYMTEKVLCELCGNNRELIEGMREQRIFRISYDNPTTWKGLQFAIKVIQDSPNVIYAYTNARLTTDYNCICDRVLDYLNMCADMKRTPTTKDFLNEQARTRYLYYNWRYNHEVEVFLKRYSDILKFNYGDLEVVLPTEPKDLTREGNNNHNCVGGYINYVISGTCIIVFVRHRNSPDKSYITCEIDPNGNIRQFYLSYNTRIESKEDEAFHKHYQEYLNQHIDEIKALCRRL